MSHPVKGIDHCFILVDDLDQAAEQYAAMGFTLSPRGIHSEAKGSANYTIMFPEDYFEILGIIKATALNVARRDALELHGQGLHAVACRIDDAHAAARDLDTLGIKTTGLNDFERPVKLADGTTGTAAFSTLSFMHEDVPLGSVFMCHHKTPETVWLPELIEHPNTACALNAILAVSDEPEKEAMQFSRLWAAGTVTATDGVYRIDTGAESAPLILLSLSKMQRQYPGIDLSSTASGAFTCLQIRVSEIETTRMCLSNNGIRVWETKSGIAVAAGDACGAIIEFVD